MFTGIVEEIGTVKAIHKGNQSYTLEISCRKVLEGTKLGDSIAVNGACLTVNTMNEQSFTADCTPETMRRTAFSLLRVGGNVHLERALQLGGRLGGHIMLGHVDTTGKVISFEKEGNGVNISFTVPYEWMKYIVEKGSIAIDGVSLTVAAKKDNGFSVALIPHTGEETLLLKKHVGDPVNIECDYLGKYVESFLKKSPSSNVTMDMLYNL